MQKTILSSLLSTLIVFGISACNGQENPAQNNTGDQTKTDTVPATSAMPAVIAEDVDAEKFKSLIDAGNGLLLDVRTPEEYAQGNIAGSVNIDFNNPGFDAAIDSLDKSVPVYVYCQGGGRSAKAMELMKEKGFSEIHNLTGGYGNWPYKQ